MTFRTFTRGLTGTTFAVALAFTASTAEATSVLVTSEAAITDNGNLSWGTLGPNGTAVSNPFEIAVPGVSGLTMTGLRAGGQTFERRDQDNGWGGNFGADEQLLWSSGSTGPMDFSFNQGISGFGVQVQPNYYGDFTAYIRAYDAMNNLIAEYSVHGVSTWEHPGTDTAMFIGLVSDSLDIHRVAIGVPGLEGTVQDFAINSPFIQTTGSAAGRSIVATPEPASLVLMGSGLTAIAARLRRRRR